MSVSLREAEGMLARFPRASLGFFPTPLYKLENLSRDLGIDLFIKRDDFTGRNLFGGNKIRKLEFLLGEAKAMGCDHAITYGATQSNHAMETAAACRAVGIQPILYLTAVVPPDEADTRSNLLLDKILGAEIHIVDILPGESEDDADLRAAEMGARQAESLTRAGHPTLNIPMGGANSTGSLGFMAGYLEFAAQAQQMGIAPDWIFHATGTGGTMAGLAAGRKLIGGRETIASITVSPKNDAYLKKVAGIADELLSRMGAEERVDWQRDLFMDTGYYAPGYEMPNPMASEAIRTLARREGLFVDPVYTGKAFAGLLDYVKTGKVKPGQTVVFWHTGGATALFAEKEMLGDIT